MSFFNTLTTLAVYAASFSLVYIISLLIYRFFLHPLKHIPGPTLARATYLYEWYYDICLSGQYTFKIKELHKRHGPVIRINPDQVHIDDPDYFDEIFNQTNGRANKPANDAEAFGPYPAVSPGPGTALSLLFHLTSTRPSGHGRTNFIASEGAHLTLSSRRNRLMIWSP